MTPSSKRVLFVCEQNLAESAMAEVILHLHHPRETCILQAIFQHMGPNMARGWLAESAGTKVKIRQKNDSLSTSLSYSCMTSGNVLFSGEV